MIEYRQGDLFESGLPALAHGVNCQALMGAGIARSFAERWPRMRDIYQGACLAGNLRLGDVLPFRDLGTNLWIFNLATQFFPGRDAQPWAIAASIGQMIRIAIDEKISQVGMPLIGCGIGGLRRGDLMSCLEPYRAAPVDLIVYEYTTLIAAATGGN